MLKQTVGLVVFALASVVTCSGGSSSSSSGSSSSGDIGPEPIYAGDATDECWRSIYDAKNSTTTDAVNGGQFLVPTEGASLPPEPPPNFAWSTPLASLIPSSHGEPVPALRRPFELQLVANALAHGTPTTGDVSWSFLHIPGHDDVVLFTTEATWTPEAAPWSLIKQAGTAEVTAEIYTAYAIQNHITQGPYKAPGIRHFRIQ